MSNAANAILNKAGIFVDGPRLYTTKTLETRNMLGLPYGNVWYVDKSVTSSGNGKSWSKAKATITEALALAQDYDIIRIAAGFYTEAATLTVTQVGLKIFGENTTGKTRGPVGIKTPTSAGPCITVAVNANDVEIAGIAFITTSGQKGIQLGGATTGYVWRTHIHDCSFHGDGTGTYAIAVYGATTSPQAGAFPDVAECTIEDNWFYAWATAAICAYGTRVAVKNNTIFIPANGYGIVIGVGRPFGDYTGNHIFGVNSGDTGFIITGTDEDALNLVDNRVVNVATPITLAKYTSWYDGNYFGLDDHLYHTPVADLGKNIHGNAWCVDKSVTTTGDGKCWKSAFKTITEAFAAAGDYDTIIVAAGFYTEAATITVTQIGLKLMGMNTSGKTRGPVAMKTPTAAGAILSLTSSAASTGANDMEICNIGFIATSGQKGIQLGTASTGYLWRTHIHDCGFFGDGSGTYAIGNYGATTTPSAGAFPDVAECVVENCFFYAWATAAICTYGTRVANKDNFICTPAGGVGIVLGCGRPFSEISGNKILGVNSTDTGILITGNDDGSTLVYNNAVAVCATLITPAVSDAGLVNNPAYADGAALAQCDPT